MRLNFLFFINSFFWKQLLKFHGFEVGNNFYIEGFILIKLKSKRNKSKLIIGNNVKFLGNIDIRTREEGSLIIENNVSFDDDVRIVAARSAIIYIENGCEIGKGTIINAGANVTIKENTLIGPYCLVQASNHGFSKNGPIKGQPYNHSPITIGKGCWLAANVVILPGINIGDGAILGASAVATKNIKSNSINAGNPSQKISDRFQQ